MAKRVASNCESQGSSFLNENEKMICDTNLSLLVKIVKPFEPVLRAPGGAFGGGGYLTSFWTGTCHRGFKNIPVPYTNYSKMYTRLYTNFPKMHTRPYANCENCEN